MYTEFHLNADELDNNFINKIKKLFGSKFISIIIEEEPDETEYLLKSEVNRKALFESIQQVEDGKLIKVKIGKTNSK